MPPETFRGPGTRSGFNHDFRQISTAIITKAVPLRTRRASNAFAMPPQRLSRSWLRSRFSVELPAGPFKGAALFAPQPFDSFLRPLLQGATSRASAIRFRANLVVLRVEPR